MEITIKRIKYKICKSCWVMRNRFYERYCSSCHQESGRIIKYLRGWRPSRYGRKAIIKEKKKNLNRINKGRLYNQYFNKVDKWKNFLEKHKSIVSRESDENGRSS